MLGACVWSTGGLIGRWEFGGVELRDDVKVRLVKLGNRHIAFEVVVCRSEVVLVGGAFDKFVDAVLVGCGCGEASSCCGVERSVGVVV